MYLFVPGKLTDPPAPLHIHVGMEIQLLYLQQVTVSRLGEADMFSTGWFSSLRFSCVALGISPFEPLPWILMHNRTYLNHFDCLPRFRWIKEYHVI